MNVFPLGKSIRMVKKLDAKKREQNYQNDPDS